MLMEQTDRQIENDRARVTRLKMAPGAHTGLHRHEYATDVCALCTRPRVNC